MSLRDFRLYDQAAYYNVLALGQLNILKILIKYLVGITRCNTVEQKKDEIKRST
jgi:hypothetical protein